MGLQPTGTVCLENNDHGSLFKWWAQILGSTGCLNQDLAVVLDRAVIFGGVLERCPDVVRVDVMTFFDIYGRARKIGRQPARLKHTCRVSFGVGGEVRARLFEITACGCNRYA